MANYLFASLFWGLIGTGFFIYGKKMQEFPPMAVGILLVVGSYLFEALPMSGFSIVLIGAYIWLRKNGMGR
jgi:hypothetical protein